MKILSQITLSFLLLCTSAISNAEDITGYEIELIIFENANGRYLNSEDWSYNDSLMKVQAEKFENDSSSDKEYKELGWKSAKLEKSLDRLLNNPNFKVLVNKRWKQTGLDRKDTLNIKIGSSQQSSDSSTTEREEIIGNINPQSNLEPYITGDVRLIMSRYLHFNVNLKYFKPLLNNNAEYEFKTFPIVSERRMKSKEVHYIDHPLVGIVVLATPYKIKVNDAKS